MNIFLFFLFFIYKSSTGELLINNSLLGGPISSNHENETTQYQEELTGIKKNIENISDTVSYLEVSLFFFYLLVFKRQKRYMKIFQIFIKILHCFGFA